MGKRIEPQPEPETYTVDLSPIALAVVDLCGGFAQRVRHPRYSLREFLAAGGQIWAYRFAKHAGIRRNQ